MKYLLVLHLNPYLAQTPAKTNQDIQYLTKVIFELLYFGCDIDMKRGWFNLHGPSVFVVVDKTAYFLVCWWVFVLNKHTS